LIELISSPWKIETTDPSGNQQMKIPSLCPEPDTLIFTHCAGGGRASLAAARLQEMGYTNVHAITDKFENIKAVFG